MSVRVQKTEKNAEAASKDGQDVKVTAVVNWRFRSDKVNKVYQEIGDVPEMDGNILLPAIDEVVKAATAKMQALEILSNRTVLKDNIDKVLKERMIKYNVLIDDISLTQVSFSPEFNAAIESKQVAEQQAKQAQFVADKAIKEAEAEVNRAKGSAEAQRLQQQTLTVDLLQKMAIEKWDGHFPSTFSGSQLPFLKLVQ